MTFPEGLKDIGKNAFKSCYTLEEIILPQSLDSLDVSCFDGCMNVVNIVLSPALKKIPRGAFSYCSSIEKIDIPEGVEVIGEMAFASCDELRTVKIPSTVTTLEKACFCDNWELAEVHCAALTPPTCGKNAFADMAEENVLYVPSGTKQAYETADTWSDFASIVEEETTDIKKNTVRSNVYETARYNIAGQSIGNDRNGIQIIKYSDGTSVKTVK